MSAETGISLLGLLVGKFNNYELILTENQQNILAYLRRLIFDNV